MTESPGFPSHVHRIARDGEGDPADAAPDRVRAGSGVSRVWNAFSDPTGRFHVGHWRAEVGSRAVSYTETELCLLLEGRVRLTSAEGSAEFGPFEPFVIAPGFEGTWETLEPLLKLYVILE